MYPLVVGVHIVLCLLLMIIVLLQPGKGGDLAAAFGSSRAFGPLGPTSLLQRATPFIAGFFMATSILLAWSSDRSTLAGSDVTSELQRIEAERNASASASGEASGEEAAPAAPEVPAGEVTPEPAGAAPIEAAPPAPSAEATPEPTP